jgi:hypothetical protein
MANSATVNASAYLGAALAGATLLAGGSPAPYSSAYLPVPLAVVLSERPAQLAAAAALAFIPPFCGTLLASGSTRAPE